jgi:alpha-methylacyl-CoA racemase
MTSGQHPPGPLRGIRVVELGGIGPGPFAGMMLADLGAEVVRIDRPGRGGLRLAALERGRRSVVLDLRRPEGVAAALQLVERADVLIEGFRPGVTERLGLGPEECWQRNPKLVYGRMTGWGQDGPWAQTAGHDIGYVAVTGTLHAIGRAGGPPQVPLNIVGDFGGGAMYLVAGVLAALLEARTSGRGQVVDAAIVDGAASLMAATYGMLAAGAWRDERGRNLLDTGTPYYDVYETADGGHMAVGALEPRFYAEFVSLLGLDPDDADRDDAAGWPALRERIAAAFKARTRDEWAAVFDGSDACVAPVLSMTEAPSHPQLAARGTFVDLDGARVPAPAPRFSRTPGAVQSAPGETGAHTRATLTEWGVSDVDSLIESGVAVQT